MYQTKLSKSFLQQRKKCPQSHLFVYFLPSKNACKIFIFVAFVQKKKKYNHSYSNYNV